MESISERVENIRSMLSKKRQQEIFCLAEELGMSGGTLLSFRRGKDIQQGKLCVLDDWFRKQSIH